MHATPTPPPAAATAVSVSRPGHAVLRALAALILALALVGWGLAGQAHAEETVCSGTLGAETHDNILVPDGATCTLQGTHAEGTVVVGTGSTLVADAVDVIGNIQAEGAVEVTVRDSVVGGSVQLEQGSAATVTGNQIDSDLQLESNDAALQADDNTIGGNLQANQNLGGVAINRNTIDGNLQCQANTPAPTGGGNVVHGSAEDQCATLTGPGTGDPDPTPTTPPPGETRTTSRLAGPDRFATAAAIAQRAFPAGAPVVYLARSDDFADALAGGSLADGPLLLVPSCGDVPAVVLDEVRRLDPTEVIALGGTGAICDDTLLQAAGA